VHAGLDKMLGRDGSDTYIVDDMNDLVTNTVHMDTRKDTVDGLLAANVESLILTRTAIKGTGNDLNNTITGNTSNNILTGGRGNDTLLGGAGVDTFVLNQPSQGVDTIKDFVSGTDKLSISASEFGGGLVAVPLLGSQLRLGAGVVTANTSTQRFLFNTTNGNLYFDADGVGGVGTVQIARLEGVTNLSSGDFYFRAQQ
jgi:Ca2+-binding RTX toxin-like protein